MQSHLHIIINALGIVHLKDENVLHSMHFTLVTVSERCGSFEESLQTRLLRLCSTVLLFLLLADQVSPLPAHFSSSFGWVKRSTLPCRWQVQPRPKAPKVHTFQHNCPLLLWFLSLRYYVILLRIVSFVGTFSLCHCFADSRSIFCFRFLPS